MPAETPILIEPEKYAVSGEHLTGELALNDMLRLCELILNDDGIVDVTDLLLIVGSWGPCE